jgi:parallel beta-helix repeat protein
MSILKALIPAVALLAAAPALGAEYHVSPAGDDNASGKAEAPWKTLQKAADTVTTGDRVVVEDGEYRGFTVDQKEFGPGRVVFVARNKWKARITAPTSRYGRNDGIAIISSSYVTIDGFEVTKARRAGIGVRSLGPEPTGKDTRDNIIRNCWSHDNGAWGKGIGAHDGIFTGWALNVLIEGNTVEHNAEHGIYVSNSADNPIVRNNIVRGNWAQGIQINADGDEDGDGIISNWEISGNIVSENALHGGGSTAINLDGAVKGRAFNNLIYGNGRGGFVLWQGNGNSGANDNVIFNNTVYNPAGDKAAFIFYNGASNNLVFNNILYSKSGGIEVDEDAGKGNKHDYNLVASVVVNDRKSKLGPNEASPPVEAIFLDPAKGNLRPKPGSPSVKKGTPSFSGRAVQATDLEGRPRPQSTPPDIGCYESAATAQR